MALVACALGSGHAGAWQIDAAGLPAYELRIDQRCDPAGAHWSPRPRPQRDPIHVVGDGLGTVAMAHASGGVDVYTQDRGHKWPVRIDTWDDPDHPGFPPQLGGAIGYVVVDGAVHSTRFEDLPIEDALARQRRTFGVGYVETTTAIDDDLVVTRRTFAAAGTRALVTEVTIENAGAAARDIGVVELWDVNLAELPIELVTSDLLNPQVTTLIEQRRRDLAARFHHDAAWDPAARVASIATAADAPPVGPDDVSEVDWYPETLWLAPVDDDAPDAVWLADDELWPDRDRAPPVAAAAPGDTSPRRRALPGANQPGVLALRVPVAVPAGGRVVRRFAFGVVPHDGDPIAAATAVRAAAPTGDGAADAWRPRLVWAAFPGLPAAGALQRELAWSSYAMQALATVDAYHGTRLLGQGGSYKYIHGIDGAIGDLAIFADAVLPIDPELAADTLAYALSTQHGPGELTPWRYPYATTGVGAYSDAARYTMRSDAYFLLPSTIARYVAFTRDAAFLDREVAYWPVAAGATGTVLDHLARTYQFARDTLGLGARGLVAMGTGDYADGVLQTATEPATPTGTSSVYNAGFVVMGFGLLHDVLAPRDRALADAVETLRASQATALEAEAWNGRWYERGFVDSGHPLGADRLFLEPQVLPILAGLTSPGRRAALLDLVDDQLETSIGAVSTIALTPSDGGDVDAPQIGGVWPVANAWLTEAYAIEDPARGWDSLIRNTLFRHASVYPALWYGIWTGPDSFYGPDAERPGEADAHLATALTDYPALNVHVHAAPLRALLGVLGIEPRATGLAIAPRVPTERFDVIWPRLALSSRPDRIAGSITPVGSGRFELAVALPSGLRAGRLRVLVNGAPGRWTRHDDTVTIVATARAGEPLAWSIASADR